MNEEKVHKILEALKNKSSAKQYIYRHTLEVFGELKGVLQELAVRLSKDVSQIDGNVEVSYSEQGSYEASMKFSGDTLFFMMHTNVFTFPADHFIHKLDYVKEDPMRSYCGMIMVYNFLSDSVKYNRMDDLGYLIARIFVNKDGHFFVQGIRQFSFLFKDFSQDVITREVLEDIAETAMLHSIDFDLFVPPFDNIKAMSLHAKVRSTGNAAIKTGKRLGFTYSEDVEEGE